MNATNQRALHNFDVLPDAAHVRLPVVMTLFGVSPATVWRWSRSGRLPQPTRISGVTFWNVGELRKILRTTMPRMPLSGLPPSIDPGVKTEVPLAAKIPTNEM